MKNSLSIFKRKIKRQQKLWSLWSYFEKNVCYLPFPPPVLRLNKPCLAPSHASWPITQSLPPTRQNSHLLIPSLIRSRSVNWSNVLCRSHLFLPGGHSKEADNNFFMMIIMMGKCERSAARKRPAGARISGPVGHKILVIAKLSKSSSIAGLS